MRLKIIDLSEEANQPFVSSDGKYMLIFNGEIYNHIRKQLNWSFKTKSDTEVILASIIQRGINWFLSKANGMFAFAFYDIEQKKLMVARDRFGIKPLFYYLDDEKLIFSSEIYSLLSSGLISPLFNNDAIDNYLAYRSDHILFLKKFLISKQGLFILLN